MKIQLFILCCILQSIYGSQELNDGTGTKSMCSLQRVGNKHICAGAIISKKWIITAAHCVADGVAEVLVGANCLNENGKRYVVDRSVVHPNYRQHNFNSYIALVKVKDEIDFNDRVQPIPYASQEFPDNVNASYTEWNLVEPICLQVSTPKVHHTKHCKNTEWGSFLDETHICADLCHHDAGGPLLWNDTLIGIKAFGAIRCWLDFPDVFTKVSYFHDWIKQITTG